MLIRTVAPEAAPIALLLTADPSIERIRRYLPASTIFVGEENNGAVVSVAALGANGLDAELLNIAVTETRQGRGLGRRMLAHVLAHAANAGARRMLVGTGNSSFDALAFYQKCGFRIVGVVRGFFDDYHSPIVEKGIVCRDMVRLAIDLDETARTVAAETIRRETD